MADLTPERIAEGYPASWVRVVLRVSPKGEMHAVGGDREGDAETGDCPYPGLERIQARIAELEAERNELAAERERISMKLIAEEELSKNLEAAVDAARREKGVLERLEEWDSKHRYIEIVSGGHYQPGDHVDVVLSEPRRKIKVMVSQDDEGRENWTIAQCISEALDQFAAAIRATETP